ncbi:MAG: PilZ domain-containing protein [Desulfobacterales bacterium]
MPKRVKIFRMDKDPRVMEGEINQWLQNKANIEILELSAADYRDSEGNIQSILFVFYEGTHRDASEEADKGHRRHERIYLHEIVEYIVDGEYYRDFIQDVSESGIFIRSGRKFHTGKEILMSLVAPGQDRPVKIKGEVVRTASAGIGVEFKRESQVQEDVIKALVKKLQRAG